MTTASFLLPHAPALARLVAALETAPKPAYHRAFLPHPFLLLVAAALIAAAVAYLTWRGQQHWETTPGERHPDPR